MGCQIGTPYHTPSDSSSSGDPSTASTYVSLDSLGPPSPPRSRIWRRAPRPPMPDIWRGRQPSLESTASNNSFEFFQKRPRSPVPRYLMENARDDPDWVNERDDTRAWWLEDVAVVAAERRRHEERALKDKLWARWQRLLERRRRRRDEDNARFEAAARREALKRGAALKKKGAKAAFKQPKAPEEPEAPEAPAPVLETAL